MAVQAAMQSGVDVRGYIFWTVSDNWGWANLDRLFLNSVFSRLIESMVLRDFQGSHFSYLEMS